ncbi:PAS domain S-box protein [Desulfobulbus alkaliphilus]|uniref:PAS domain S-box protein n=1 Tax=Desulfobulbus alkaliphilus TaxID=869814 RepID=UPI001963F556|nr:PAS domain S-box protein [Desulfobulbus alkaliphilus]MBM9537823.1 PAS domain S-box protein [Desulfobulbus alkaliphilus]
MKLMQTMKDLAMSRHLFLGLLTVLIVTGTLVAWWLTNRADLALRKEHLGQARLVAESINLERLRALTGTEADLTSPVYLRLKEQLASICTADPQCRFVYLMGQELDGTVFFLIDSEPAGSEDESPPGQVYEEISPEDLRVFETKTAMTVGPMTDRWGTWVSSLIPVLDPRTNDLIAVLGMDTDARAWGWRVAAQGGVLVVGLSTLALVAIVVAGSFLLARRARLEEPPRWMGHLETIMVVAIGLVLTLLIAWLAQGVSKRNQAESFRLLAESQTNVIAEVFRSLRDVELEGLAKFHENSEHVTAETFLNFTEYLIRNPAVDAWGWVQILPGADKERFVQAARAAGMEGFEIWQRNAAGKAEPVGEREIYYPVFQGAPEDKRTAIGFDIGSEPVRLAAIQEALRTGLPTATEPLTLVLETGDQKGMLLLRPVFADPEHRHPLGMAFAVLRLGDVLAVSDVDDWVAKDLICAHGDGSFEPLAHSWTKDSPPIAQPTLHRPVLAFGKTFIVTAHAGPEFVRAQPARGGLSAALVGLLLTVALAVVVTALLRRRQVLERLVRERTVALRKSEEHLSATLRSIGDGVIASDNEGRIVSLNRAAETLTGWQSEEALGRPIHEVFRLINGEKGETDAQQVFQALREGANVDGVYHATFVTRDGREYRIAASCAPIREASGVVDGAVLVFRDVTEEYRQREELRESELRFKALHNASFGGIGIHDQGLILECNQGLAAMTGFTHEELIGMDGLLLIAEQSRPAVLHNIRSGYEQPYEAFGLRKNGEEYPLRLEARNIPYKGKMVRVTEFRDITEHKRAAAENEKLQAQLLQAQKMETVGRLAGGVAHDFNNMLGVILGYAEMALEQVAAGHPMYKALHGIQQAAQRSADLTRQLLAFARKQTIAPRRIDLNETVEGMLSMLRRLIGEDIALTWLPGRNLYPINMDPAQIDQILANLCVNARDAIEGVGKVTIETGVTTVDETWRAFHPEATPGEYVLLAVSDNGCGMNREIVSHLFEPFFTTKEQGQGTGLGLASVYGAVTQNNGFIAVDSEPGQGTTFKIYLPRYTETRVETQPIQDRVEAAATGHETILLVEDEPATLEMTSIMLERQGYTVLAVGSPEEAIRLAGEYSGRIDLLMTDVVMPGMNGRALAENLLSRHPDIKCLFMSGYTADIIAHHGVLDQGVHFIQKPFSMNDLTIKVREILDNGSAV